MIRPRLFPLHPLARSQRVTRAIDVAAGPQLQVLYNAKSIIRVHYEVGSTVTALLTPSSFEICTVYVDWDIQG